MFTISYRPAKTFVRLQGDKSSTISPTDAAANPLFGFCGIAAPASFRNTLVEAGIRLSGFQAYDDHYHYSGGDVKMLLDRAVSSGAGGLITTEKDLVKVRNLFPADFPLLALPIELDPEDDFELFLRQHLAELLSPRPGVT